VSKGLSGFQIFVDRIVPKTDARALMGIPLSLKKSATLARQCSGFGLLAQSQFGDAWEKRRKEQSRMIE
jgi:hypothetical protein